MCRDTHQDALADASAGALDPKDAAGMCRWKLLHPSPSNTILNLVPRHCRAPPPSDVTPESDVHIPSIPLQPNFPSHEPHPSPLQASADERHSQGDLTSWARERAMAWRKRARTDAHPLPDARPYLAISRPISRTLGETASVLKRVRRISRERAGEVGRELARCSERVSARAESSSVGEKGGRLVSFPAEGQAGDGMPSAPPSPPSPPQHTRVAAADADDDSCDDVDADAGADSSANDNDEDDVVVGASSATRRGAARHDLEGGAEGGTVQGAARSTQGGTLAGEAEGTRTTTGKVQPEEVPPAPAVPRRRETVSLEGEDSPTSRDGKSSSRDSARRCASFAHGCFSSVAVARRRSNATRQGYSASVKGRASTAASADVLRSSSRAFTRPSTSISSSSSGSPEIGDEPLWNESQTYVVA